LPPPAPTTQPPPLPHPLPPGYPPASNSTSSTSAMSIPWLSLAAVNQAASQRHASINYVADTMTGPPHAPTWTVHCLIDNVERGVGIGKNQKIAKEEAAKNAFITMGWNT